MTVFFSAPEDTPFGRLHPAQPYGAGFSDGGRHWPSVAHYCLAQSLASEADREAVRATDDPQKAAAVAEGKPRHPDAEASRFDVLRHALTCSFEANLGPRALLLGTGDAPIEARLGADVVLGVGPDGRGENLLGKVLMEVRAHVRQRANDPLAIQCIHRDVDPDYVRTVCEHRLQTSGPYHRHFTGVDAEYELLCEACCAALPAPPSLRRICFACLRHQLMGPRLADLGTPAFRERVTSLRFAHQPCTAPAEVVAFAPVSRMPNTWWMLDRQGRLHRVDVVSGSVEAGGSVDPSAVDLTKPLVLVVAPGGELAAIGEAYGLRAVVVEPASGKVIRTLVRGDYCAEECCFPLGFFELEGRLLLVHATDWNRLDVSDARTGALLTAREEVDLDYFHSSLLISPDGARAVDNGWIWHPVGEVRVFDLRRWVRENPGEAEDGPSMKALTQRPYFWDGPVAWLEATTVAVWGGGEDEPEVLPMVTIYDVESGQAQRSFLGPGGGLLPLPPYLVAFNEDGGTTVWDWHTGERLAQDRSFQAVDVHPASHELLSRTEDGGFQVSRLEGV